MTWREVAEGVDPRDFTIRSMPARIAEIGDLWAEFRKSKGIDLERATRRIGKRSLSKR